jgi:hypothetical protein
MKDFTVGDMIKVLQRFSPDLPMYDSYDDNGVCWFNLARPKPKVKPLYLIQYTVEDEVVLALTDNKQDCKKNGGKLVAEQKVLILYPMKKNEIEVG